MLAAHGSLCELLHGHAHGVREVCHEGAAAGGAGLVQADVLDDAVLDLQALHVLAANVQDEVDVGHEGLGAAQVCHCLDLAGVRLQGLDEDALAVARGGNVADGAVRGQVVVDVVHDLARGAQDVAVVVVVPGVQELAVLAHHGGLHGGGAGVQANEDAAVVAVKRTLGNHLRVVAGLELLVVGLGGKQRVQARDLGALGVTQAVQLRNDVSEGHVLLGLAGQRRARGHEEVGVLRNDAVLLVQLEAHVEAVAKLGQVLQRAAQEGHVAADGVAARQARDGLVGHGLEYGGGHVRAGGALVQQGLHVGLGKDAAAAGYGVDVLRVLGQLVQAGSVRLHEGGHLVDEGARAAGAGAVHALLNAVIKVDDLGVLAAQLNGHVRLRNECLHRALGGNDLLHELHVQPLGQQHAAGAGDGDAHLRVAQHLLRLDEDLARGGLDVGVVTLVVGVDQVVVVVDDGQLDGGGAHVDAQAQVRVREVRPLGGAELGAVLLELQGVARCLLRRGRGYVVSHCSSPSGQAGSGRTRER